MRRAMVAVLATAAILVPAAPAPGVQDQGVPFVVSESWGCGLPRSSNPLASRFGSLADSERIRGPYGDLFGRTIGQVRDELVWWDVPMSDGERLLVHRRMLPALQRLEENLAAEDAAGNHYPIRSQDTYGFVARTTRSGIGISYHGLGAAIDINAADNPYRTDNVLITDMPGWFVDAWREAGFCWGGDWLTVKDTMHFSWMGPGATPGYGELPPPYPTLTEPAYFGELAMGGEVVFGAFDPASGYLLADGSGDGALDMVRVRPHPDGAVLEISRASAGYSECSILRWFLPDPSLDGRPLLMADVAGSGRPDLLFLDTSGETLTVTRYPSIDGYGRPETIATAVPPGDAHLAGDLDRDGLADLWVVRHNGEETRLEVWDGGSGYLSRLADLALPLGDTEGARFVVGDRDVDGVPDLVVLDSLGGSTRMRVLLGGALSEVSEGIILPTTLGSGDLTALADYDGDGRDDLYVLRPDGAIEVRYGNVPEAGADQDGWFQPADFECPEGTVPYHYQGLFADDDGSVFKEDIEWLAASGITRGCNPPFNDWFCPEQSVTRAQMAAFLVRALALPATEWDFFSDDEGSVFEDDINRLAAAGITKGCNPPDNTRFCPQESITRGQMAAFLVRAYLLGPAVAAGFVDIAGSVFAGDIDRLAAAGITKGCDPPSNTMFCPEDPVTRGQMAAFIRRAETGSRP